MSTIDTISSLIEEKVLFPIDSGFGDSTVRKLLVSKEVKDMLEKKEEEPSWAAMNAVMQNFVSGRVISIGNKKKDTIRKLTPAADSVWALRSTTKPGIRVVGQFVEKDFFVALECAYRKDLNELGSKEWKLIVRNCKAKWRGLFNTYQPLKEGGYDEFLSNAYVH